MSLGCAIDDGYAYYQHNIVTRENKRTQQDCAAFAASIAGAHYWTWMKSTGRCFVKNSNAIKNRKPNANFVSGSTKCGKQISVGKSKTKHRHRRNVMSYRFKSLLIKGSPPEKKNVFFWALPEKGGGETPARIFLPFFSTMFSLIF